MKDSYCLDDNRSGFAKRDRAAKNSKSKLTAERYRSREEHYLFLAIVFIWRRASVRFYFHFSRLLLTLWDRGSEKIAREFSNGRSFFAGDFRSYRRPLQKKKKLDGYIARGARHCLRYARTERRDRARVTVTEKRETRGR